MHSDTAFRHCRRPGPVLVAVLAALALVGTACGSRTERALRRGAEFGPVSAVAAAPSAAPAAGDETLAASDAAPDAAVPAAAAGDTAEDAAAPAAAPSARPGSAASSVRPRSSAAGGPTAGRAAGAASRPRTAAEPGATGSQAAQGPAPKGGPSDGPAPATPGTPQAPAGKKSEIVLGAFGAESGVIGTVFASIPPADRAWAAQINARGGLNGHPVRLIMADDGADPVRTQSLVRRMVEQDKVLAIFGEYSVTINSVMPYLESKGIPVIGASGSDPSPDHYTVGFNPITSSDVALFQAAVLSIVTQTDKRNLSINYCREVIGCKNAADRIKQNLPYEGLHVVHEAQVSLGQPDFTAEVLAAQQAGADVSVTIVDAASAIRYARAAHRQGYKPVIASVHNLNMDTLLAGGDDVEGVLTISRSPVWQTSALAKPYRDAVARYQPNAPRGQIGADVFVFGKLLERVASFFQEPPTTAQLIDGLYSLNNEKLDGLLPGVTFPRSKDRTKVNVCSIPTQVKGGKFVSFDGKDTFVCWKS